MALSNWDELVMTLDGKEARGLTTPLGIFFEPYKNWLHVLDEHAWQDGGATVRPYVMTIHTGEFCYKDLYVMAVRWERGDCDDDTYFAAWTYPLDEDGKKQNEPYGVVGICCYGYQGRSWVGILDWQIKRLKQYLNIWADGWWAPRELERAAALLANAQRVNQGDQYFADKLGFDQPSTAPGDGEPPILEQAFRRPEDG
jgi:hypothetical protein